MRAKIQIDSSQAYQRYQSRQQKQIEDERRGEVLGTVLTLVCYQLYTEYDWDVQMLQDLIDNVYKKVLEASKAIYNKDWVLGVKFWKDRMGLKI